MTPLVFLGLLLSTCDASDSASNNGTESQTLANSTNAVEVARRETACTPTGTNYWCNNRGYTQVPNTVWIATTTLIDLTGNVITFIPVDAFDRLTLMKFLQMQNNAITSIPAGLLDNNLALEWLDLHDNDITLIPVRLVENNYRLKGLHLSGNPLVCTNTNSWNLGTAISTICTSCTEGTPETMTIDAVDFWQCFISESPTVSPTVSTIVSPTMPPTLLSDSACTPLGNRYPCSQRGYRGVPPRRNCP